MKQLLIFFCLLPCLTYGQGATSVRLTDLKGGTTGQVLTRTGTGFTWATGAATSYAVRRNDQTGTTYTLLESDNGKLITLTNTATVTITLPPGLSAGWNCVLEQTGAGSVVWVNGTGVTNNVYPASSTKTTAIRARVAVEHRGSNVFYLNGQIVP